MCLGCISKDLLGNLTASEHGDGLEKHESYKKNVTDYSSFGKAYKKTPDQKKASLGDIKDTGSKEIPFGTEFSAGISFANGPDEVSAMLEK